MKEVILCKYGEIILKGANKAHFEALLLREIKRRAKHIGNYSVRYAQSTVFIEPEDSEAIDAFDDMYAQIKKVFEDSLRRRFCKLRIENGKFLVR